MPPDEASYFKDWLRIAEKDWKRVQMLLDEDDPALAGFCLQQAIEKFLKAYLLVKGWHLRRIHDLDTLLEDAIHYDASLRSFQEACQKITAYYIVERYPFNMQNEITDDDIRNSRDQVKSLVEKIRNSLKTDPEE
jgi:HEPN domain-containing protein